MIDCRAGSADEFEMAADLRQEMFSEMGDSDKDAPGWRERYAAYFSRLQSTGEAQLFLAYSGNEPVGVTIVSVLENHRTAAFGTRLARINDVFVRPAYRRRGVAKRLMELAIDWARDRGCEVVRLRATDEGRRLYERLGFKPINEMQLKLK